MKVQGPIWFDSRKATRQTKRSMGILKVGKSPRKGLFTFVGTVINRLLLEMAVTNATCQGLWKGWGFPCNLQSWPFTVKCVLAEDRTHYFAYVHLELGRPCQGSKGFQLMTAALSACLSWAHRWIRTRTLPHTVGYPGKGTWGQEADRVLCLSLCLGGRLLIFQRCLLQLPWGIARKREPEAWTYV